MAVHDDSTAMEPIIVVSRISSVLRPSTPRKYSAPTDGIHGARSTNWKSALCGLYQNHSGTEIERTRRSAAMFAIQRMAFSFCLFTQQEHERADQRREQNDRKVVTHKRSIAELRSTRIEHMLSHLERDALTASSHEQINAHERENAEQHQQRVVLHETGLDAPEPRLDFLARSSPRG